MLRAEWLLQNKILVWDNRRDSTGTRRPDFVLRANPNVAVWIGNVIFSDPQHSTQLQQNWEGQHDAAWQALEQHPENFLDYRDCKRSGQVNANHPDFKSRDGQLVAWVNLYRAPIVQTIDAQGAVPKFY
jgi:hypothetical protein